MNDNEIIKGFAVCNDLENGACKKCPCDRGVYDNSCLEDMKTDVYNLINRQKAEIDRFADIGKVYSEVRAEAIREFAERLKRKSYITKPYAFLAPKNTKFAMVDVFDIDNLVKEMTEDKP